MVPSSVDDNIAAAFTNPAAAQPAPASASDGSAAPEKVPPVYDYWGNLLPPIPPDTRPLPADEDLGKRNGNPPGISFWALLKEDFHTHERDLFSQGLWAIAVHRFGNWRMDIRPRILRFPFSILYKVLFKIVEWMCGISIHYPIRVGRRVHIWHHSGIILGARSFGNDVHIRQNTTTGIARRGEHRQRKPIIQDRVDIGAGAVVVGPITVGHDSQIGANSVVIKDVPPYSMVAGVPAKIIKTRTPEELGL
jgi:serine O-acetyltransferase